MQKSECRSKVLVPGEIPFHWGPLLLQSEFCFCLYFRGLTFRASDLCIPGLVPTALVFALRQPLRA